MRKTKIIFITTILTLLGGCSSMKITDSLELESFDTLKKNKVLVISKSSDTKVIKEYEDKLVSELKKKGVDAVSRHSLYPDLIDNKKYGENNVSELLKKFRNDSIYSILVTSLKGIQESVKIIGDDDKFNEGSRYLGKYNITFNPNKTPSYLASQPDNSNEPEERITTKYFLEVVTYNISTVNEEKISGILFIEFKDPDSKEKVLNQFTKKATKQFN